MPEEHTSTDNDELIQLVYSELRRLAEHYLRRERPEHTLQPTALVHEAYLRLSDQEKPWKGKEHFIGIAATMMRRILVDHALSHRSRKRGGGIKVSIQDLSEFAASSDLALIELDEAMDALSLDFPREARIIELKFFGGCSIHEIASILRVSEPTVERSWRFARAWLFNRLVGR